MKKLLLSVVFLVSTGFAHTAIMQCFDNADGTATCEGGFSDGSSASGIKVHIKKGGKIIKTGKMNEDSSFTFKKPSGNYSVIFDAGEGHKVEVKGKDIVE